MVKQITAEDVRATLEAEWESDLPDAVLEVLRRHGGKLLTKRIIPQLPGGEAEGMNRAYFDARRERNALRAACLNSILDLEDMARQLNKVIAARAELKEAEESLDALTAYGEPFSPDCYVWNKISGKE